MHTRWVMGLVVMLASCGKDKGGRSLDGTVVDSFGKPVAGATIAPSKGDKVTAAADGTFTLSFDGATPNLVVSKPGYQQLEVKTPAPKATVTLAVAPPKDGVFLIEAQGYKELALVKLETPAPGAYKIPPDGFIKLKSGSQLAFMGMKPDENQSLGWKRMQVNEGDPVSFGPGMSFELRKRATDLTGGGAMFVERFDAEPGSRWAIGPFKRGPNGGHLLENDQALLVTAE